MRRFRPLACIAAVTSLAVPLWTGPAQAASPGANGPFVLSLLNSGCEHQFGRYLARLPSRGGALRPLTPQCEQPACEDCSPPQVSDPEASPDGRTIFAVRTRVPRPERGFLAMRPDGSEQRVALESDLGRAPSFAPDGQRFVFDQGQPVAAQENPGALWEGRLDGSRPRVIPDDPRCTACVFLNPRWAPNGKLIAAELDSTGDRESTVRRGLWLLRASDGRLVRRVAGPHAINADWSPTGRSLVYSTRYQQDPDAGGASGGNLYVVSRDGRRTRKLVHRHRIAETEPTWSPDGKRVAFVSLRYSAGSTSYSVKPSLWTVPAAGGKPKRIQGLPEPYVEEGYAILPQLTWLPRPQALPSQTGL